MNQDIGTEEKQKKHIILNRAVNHLETLLEQADNLLTDITRGDACGDACGEAEGDNELRKSARPPNLEEVLITAPQRINDYVEEISMCLTKIKDAIF